jgi:hypothetical protein
MNSVERHVINNVRGALLPPIYSWLRDTPSVPKYLSLSLPDKKL